MSHCFKSISLFFLFALLSFLVNSCYDEECACVSNSPLNGRWYGNYVFEEEFVELIVSLTEKNSYISGGGNFNQFYQGKLLEKIIICNGTFVSNKIVLEIQGIDSTFYEGYYIPNLDSINGNLFVQNRKLPLGLKKLK